MALSQPGSRHRRDTYWVLCDIGFKTLLRAASVFQNAGDCIFSAYSDVL
jgi:hypothetical protein